MEIGEHLNVDWIYIYMYTYIIFPTLFLNHVQRDIYIYMYMFLICIAVPARSGLIIHLNGSL